MILLDTHVWVWWVSEHEQLTPKLRQTIQSYQDTRLGVSIMSCWEVAKLVEIGKLQLKIPTAEWLFQALTYPGVQLLDLTLPIVVESTQLPGSFHSDPADQMIVATARVYDVPLLTADGKILDYPHVKKMAA